MEVSWPPYSLIQQELTLRVNKHKYLSQAQSVDVEAKFFEQGAARE